MNADSANLRCGPVAPPRARRGGRRRCRGDVSLLHVVYQGFAVLGLLLGSYYFFSHFVVQSVRVAGTSMWPTLKEADCYLVNRLVAFFRAPQRGDIVMIKDPTDQTYVVKRVVGAAGDTVDLRDGVVYVNGRPLHETYLPKGTQTFPYDTLRQTVRCGPDQYFVLGDNRFYSSDSRSYGPVSRGAILGLVMR